jgi:hypothetical protein
MKNVHLVFSIVIFLALVCSPVLAISKSDLISFYKGQSPAVPIPTPTVIPLKKVEATLCGSCDMPPGYAWIGGRLLLLPTTNPTLKTGGDLPGLYLQFL